MLFNRRHIMDYTGDCYLSRLHYYQEAQLDVGETREKKAPYFTNICIIESVETFLPCTLPHPLAFATQTPGGSVVFRTLFLPRDMLAKQQTRGRIRVILTWYGGFNAPPTQKTNHVIKGGEQRVWGEYFVDGHTADTKTCYEFAGWHIMNVSNALWKVIWIRISLHGAFPLLLV